MNENRVKIVLKFSTDECSWNMLEWGGKNWAVISLWSRTVNRCGSQVGARAEPSDYAAKLLVSITGWIIVIFNLAKYMGIASTHFIRKLKENAIGISQRSRTKIRVQTLN